MGQLHRQKRTKQGGRENGNPHIVISIINIGAYGNSA